MDIIIPSEWLREYLKTDANEAKIAEYLTLCGPSVERTEGKGSNSVYHIDITTNRIDCVGVLGIAREASAILPRFGIKADLIEPKASSKLKFTEKVKWLKVKVDQSLCPRFSAVLIKNVKISSSPTDIQKRLTASGVRPINNVVDISNYIMHELGQPVHTFDYDKIKGARMILRKSKKGENVTTLDDKTHNLTGGDIIIEDGEGRIIDLAGIMGGKNSAVDDTTKNVLLFVQTYDASTVRKTSMKLAHRTEAAAIFEKGMDPELVDLAIRRGIDLFVKLTSGEPSKEILDIYTDRFKTKSVTLTHSFITDRLGVDIAKSEISKILNPLGIKSSWRSKTLTVNIPSFRSNDLNIPEDIVEEIARIYGYHNIPTRVMGGALPDPLFDTPFKFEGTVKDYLIGMGADEIYTLSLVPENYASNGLKLKNPLGPDTSYLRTSLRPSLVDAADANTHLKDSFHIFEMSNVYLVKKADLPEERMMLSGILSNLDYRNAKGVIETLLLRLNINYDVESQDSRNFLPSQRIIFKSKGSVIGSFGVLDRNGYIYYEFDVTMLRKESKPVSFQSIAKYPPQIEDITFKLPLRTKAHDIIFAVKRVDKLIFDCKLRDIFQENYTFRVWYQSMSKTLTDKEVEVLRVKIIKQIQGSFGAVIV